MTITPGAPWGRQVPRPGGLVVVDGDHALAAALASADRDRPLVPVTVRSGDMARTLGVRGEDAAGARADKVPMMMNELPIDLLDVRVGGAGEPMVACAHVIVRSPWHRGHWWRGPIVAVMNAEFLGDWDLVPRGHPNDGRAEVVEVDASLSVRDRLAARRRLPSGTHVPHPCISTRSIRHATWSFPRALEVIVDGRHVGRASSLAVTVLPDAATVYA